MMGIIPTSTGQPETAVPRPTRPAPPAGLSPLPVRLKGRAVTLRLPWSLVLLASALAWLGLAVPSSALAASLTASVDRNVVPIGETITLSLTFEGVNANTPPSLPAVRNFQTGRSSGYRSEFSFEGGRQSLKHIFQYSLVATQVGDTQFPAITAQVGGQTLTSQPIQLRVIPASQAAAAAAAAAEASKIAFLRLVVPKTEVYLGEPFAVEIHLYWQNARDFRMPQIRADGFTTGPMSEPSQSRTQVGDTVYNLAVFRLTARAARAGSLTLGPAEESLVTFTRANFFGQPLDPKQLTLTSETIPMRVLALPSEGVPEGFNGAIGTYQLAVNAGPTTLSVGDPITVRVRISGQGPLDALTYPAQTGWRDFNSYPATAKLETSDPLGLSGAKSFEQVIIPQNHEIKSLPPFKFSFFDPAARQYRTLSGPEIPLNIRASAGTSTPAPVLTNAPAQGPGQETDILHIRPHLDLERAPAPLLARPWFLAVQAVPFALWLALFFRRKHGESLAGNPRLRRQREVARRIQDGLVELKGHAAASRSDEFFALLFRLLQEQIGERLDLPASAITESVIDDKLRARGLTGEAGRELHELFQACNVARYAPTRDRHALDAFVPRLETAIRALQALPASP